MNLCIIVGNHRFSSANRRLSQAGAEHLKVSAANLCIIVANRMFPSANRERQPYPTEVPAQITRKKEQTVHTDARRLMTMMFVNAALDILQRQQQYECRTVDTIVLL